MQGRKQWYYERNRGQYKSEFKNKREKLIHEKQYPFKLLKNELGTISLPFECKPWIAQGGAEKSFTAFHSEVSKLYETPSWPNKSNPKFLNLIIECKTKLTIIDLFEKVKRIEILLGRKKSIKNAPRACDIDIIDFNNSCKNIVHNGKKIVTPHPRMHERNFTLIPLYEIKKNWIHPKSKQKIDILIKKLSSKSISDIKIYQTSGIIKYA